jgi:TatA/E family protein of Tat protein translocase
MGIESPLHLLFLGAVALVVLGPKRLPGLARALGKGIREFRGAFDEASAPGQSGAPVPDPDADAMGPAAPAASQAGLEALDPVGAPRAQGEPDRLG